MRTPVPHRSPPRKDFCRAKMPCGGQVFQICCSARKSSDFLQTSGYLHARKRVLPKYVEDCPIGKAMQIRNSRDLKRAAAFLFPKESRGNHSQGFPLGNFFLTADAVLLCAAKKNGVGTRTSWHVTPEAHWPYLATAGKTKNTAGVTRTKEVPYGRIFAHQSI